ncbi:MAG: hypothetical protein ABSE87_13815 [Terracidiphilus sp.]|jgi:hypothetical protein
MDLNRLYALIAAQLASLFLVLVLCTFEVRRPGSVGFRIPMLRIHRTAQNEFDCEGRFEFLRLTRDGKTWVNSTEIPASQVRPTVATLMENRAERVVYVVGDSELPYGQFAKFLDSIEGATEDLHVVVVSGEIRRQFEESRALVNPSKPPQVEQEPLDVCDFVLPANEFPRETVNSPSQIPPRN